MRPSAAEEEEGGTEPCVGVGPSGLEDGSDPEEAQGGGAAVSLLWQDNFNSQPPSGPGKYLYTAPSGTIKATSLSGRNCLVVNITAGQPRDENVRSELSLWAPGESARIFKKDPIGSTRWYALSVYVPTSWWTDENKLEIIQWHGSEDPEEEGIGRNPPLSLMISRSSFIIRQLWSSKRIQTANENRVDLWKRTVEKGKWITFVFHMKWSYKYDGFLEVWANGTKIINQYNRPNCYNDAEGPYLKFGLYWPAAMDRGEYSSSAKHILYFDSLRIGDQRHFFSDMK